MALMGLRPPFSCSHPLDPNGRCFLPKKPHYPRFYSPPRRLPFSRDRLRFTSTAPEVSAFRDSIPDPLQIFSLRPRACVSLIPVLTIDRSWTSVPCHPRPSILAKQFLQKLCRSTGTERGDPSQYSSLKDASFSPSCTWRQIERRRKDRGSLNGIFIAEKRQRSAKGVCEGNTMVCEHPLSVARTARHWELAQCLLFSTEYHWLRLYANRRLVESTQRETANQWKYRKAPF